MSPRMALVGAARDYALQMQAALLRTISAVLRAGAEDGVASADAIQAELEAVQRELAALPLEGRPMLDLAARFGWTAQEIDFLWVTVALATDPRLFVHARALDGNAVQGMSTALYSRIARLDAASSQSIGRALQADRSLPRIGLLQAAPGSWLPTSTPWSPVPELLQYLLDGPGGSRLPLGIVALATPGHIVLDDAQRDALDLIAATLSTPDILLIVSGPEATGRRSAIAQSTSRAVLALDLASHDASPDALALALLGLFREASLRDAIAVIVNPEELDTTEARDSRRRTLALHVEQATVPVVLITSREGFELRSTRPTVRVTWNVPDVSARLVLWRHLTGDEHPALAQRYRIGAGAIERAVASARAIARKGAADLLTAAELVAGMRHNTAQRMAGLAERIVVKQTWDDCVLPDDVESQIIALIGRAE